MKYTGYRKMELRELQLMQLEVMKLIHNVCVKNDIKYYIIAGTLLGAVRHGGFIPWDDDIDIAMMREDYEKFKLIFHKEFDQSKFFLQYYDTDKCFQPALMRFCIKDTIMDIPSEYHLHHCKNSYLDIFPLDNAPAAKELQDQHSKEISKIDNIIRWHYYHIYEKDNLANIFIKKVVSMFLRLLPLESIKKKRLKVMQMYNNNETGFVCSTVSHYKYSKQVMSKEVYGEPKLMKFETTELYAPAKYIDYLEHLYGKNYMKLPPVEKREKPSEVYVKE